MTRKLRISVLALFLLYALSLLIGRPTIVPSQETEVDEFMHSEMDGLENPSRSDLLQDERNRNKEKAGPRIQMAPGLIETVIRINRAIEELNDPLLESDARPDRFFRLLGRSNTLNVFLLLLSTVWSIMLLLTIMAERKNQWFSRNMMTMILGPSLLAILGVLFFQRKYQLYELGPHPFLLSISFLEVMLFMAGLYAMIQVLMPHHPLLDRTDKSFMEHMQQTRNNALRMVQKYFKVLFHIGIIGIAALAIANALLLPLYMLQENFPTVFVIFLLLVLLGLAFFYVVAYNRVSYHSTGENRFAISITFLGFRFLNNSLFLAILAGVVFLVLGLVVVVTMLNVGFLQTIELLQKPQGL